MSSFDALAFDVYLAPMKVDRVGKWGHPPSWFLVGVLYVFIASSLGLVFLQATEHAVTRLPVSLAGVAEMFWGPAGTIESLKSHGYEKFANKFEAFFVIQLLLLVTSLVISIPYVMIRKIAIQNRYPDYDWVSLLKYILLLGVCVYLLFLDAKVDYDDFGLYPRDIHLSVRGYLQEACASGLLYMLGILPFLIFNQLYRNTGGGAEHLS